MERYAALLFSVFDQEADHAAKAIRNRIFSAYRELPWTREDRYALEPMVRAEIDNLIQGILGAFDNVGGILPDGVLGYEIRALPDDPDAREAMEDDAPVPIGDGHTDYSDLWWEYLKSKR